MGGEKGQKGKRGKGDDRERSDAEGKGGFRDLRERLDAKGKGKGKAGGKGNALDLRDKLDGMRGRGDGGSVTGDGRGRGGGGVTGDGRGRGGGGGVTGDGRGRGGSSGRGGGTPELWRPAVAAQASGEAFSEAVTFAGRVDEFVVCGNETFVPSSRYANLKSQVGVGVVLTGVREANTRGKSKWVATSISGAAPGSGGETFTELVSYAGR